MCTKQPKRQFRKVSFSICKVHNDIVDPDNTDQAVTLLTKFHTVAGTVVTTVQNTSISANSFKEFLPKIQTLKNDLLSLKSFFFSTKEQQIQQYKFLLKVIDF